MGTLNNIRSANRLFILFLISYNLLISSAAVLQSPQYLPEISPTELSIPINEAYKYSDQVNLDQLPLCPEQLVLAADQAAYNYAIVFPLVIGNTIHLKVFNKGKIEPYTTDKIRILKLLPQILLQPHLPRRMLMLFFLKMYASKFENKMPFIQSKILPAASKILVIGNLDGHLDILQQILLNIHSQQYINKQGILAPETFMVFTGNLTGRGPDGPEIWHLIKNLKEINEKQVFILKGAYETLEAAKSDNFFGQMITATKLPRECIDIVLYKLFNSLAYGLFLGMAPDKRKDPYHFLFFCHGGFDTLVSLNNYLKKIVKAHQETSSVETIPFTFKHPAAEYSGLLRTHFRSNRNPHEEARIEPSPWRPYFYILNKSAVLNFFTQLRSSHYIVDALIRGNLQQTGISKLEAYSPLKEYDWKPLLAEIQEKIQPASIYSCAAFQKNILGHDSHTYAEIMFDKCTQAWHIISHSTSDQKSLHDI